MRSIDAGALGIPNWPKRYVDLIQVGFDGVEPTIAISSGTLSAVAVPELAIKYIETAAIPNEPWRPLSQDILSAIALRHATRSPRCGLFRLEDQVRAQACAIATARHIDETRRDNFSFLLAYLERRFAAMEASKVHGATWDEPGLHTVTINPGIGKFLGLHLDSWDGITYESRDASRTRICINLGPTCRSFVFLPIGLRDAALALSRAAPATRCKNASDVLQAFFCVFPDFPVFRVSLDSGMGYYADTDNLIHDGSSVLANSPCLHYTIRGRFERLRADESK
jgi:hypothetical protein